MTTKEIGMLISIHDDVYTDPAALDYHTRLARCELAAQGTKLQETIEDERRVRFDSTCPDICASNMPAHWHRVIVWDVE